MLKVRRLGALVVDLTTWALQPSYPSVRRCMFFYAALASEKLGRVAPVAATSDPCPKGQFFCSLWSITNPTHYRRLGSPADSWIFANSKEGSRGRLLLTISATSCSTGIWLAIEAEFDTYGGVIAWKKRYLRQLGVYLSLTVNPWGRTDWLGKDTCQHYLVWGIGGRACALLDHYSAPGVSMNPRLRGSCLSNASHLRGALKQAWTAFSNSCPTRWTKLKSTVGEGWSEYLHITWSYYAFREGPRRLKSETNRWKIQELCKAERAYQ